MDCECGRELRRVVLYNLELVNYGLWLFFLAIPKIRERRRKVFEKQKGIFVFIGTWIGGMEWILKVFDSFAIEGLKGIFFVGRFAWFSLTAKVARKVAEGTKTLRFY